MSNLSHEVVRARQGDIHRHALRQARVHDLHVEFGRPGPFGVLLRFARFVTTLGRAGGAATARSERALGLSEPVLLTREVNGMAAWSEGLLAIQGAQKAGKLVVRFWDGGPLAVPANAIARLR